MNGQISHISSIKQSVENNAASFEAARHAYRQAGTVLPARYLRRSRVVAMFENERAPVVVLTAPPGSGKTSALVEWAESSRVAVRFLSAQKPPREFLRELVTLLANELGVESNARPRSDLLSAREALVELRTRARTQHDVSGRRSLVLVVDDAQRLNESDALPALIEFLLEPHLKIRGLFLSDRALALGARADAPQISLLDPEFLRFDETEISEYVRSRSPEVLAQVMRETGGWVAGVVACTRTEDRRPPRTPVPFVIPSDLGAYLEDVALLDLTERMKTELMVAAVAEPVTVASLGVLLGDQPVRAESLAELAARCAFLTRVPGDRSEYRFQPLFRRFLLERLAKRSDARLIELHRRALAFCIDQMDDFGTIEHAVKLGEVGLAAEPLRRLSQRLVELGQMDELERLALLTKPLISRDPVAPLVAAFLEVERGEGQAACRLIELAEGNLHQLGQAKSLAGEVRAWAAWIRGAAALSMEQGSAAREIVDACLRERTELSPLLTSGLLVVKGRAEVDAGDAAGALETLVNAERVARDGGARFIAFRAELVRVRALRSLGRANEALDLCQGALREITTSGVGGRPLVGRAELELASTLLETGSSAEDVLRAAEAALRHLKAEDASSDLARAHELKARALEALDDVGGALREVMLGLEMARRQVCPQLTRRLAEKREALEASHRSVSLGHATLDVATRSVSCSGRVVLLTKREFEVLDYLRRQGGRWVPSEEIAESVFHSVHHRHSTLVRVHVHAIRQKLGSERRLIESERGRGYRARPEGLSLAQS